MKSYYSIKISTAVLFAFSFGVFPLNKLDATLKSISLEQLSKNQSLTSESIIDAKKVNNTTIELTLSNQQKILLDFYGDNIYRFFRDNSGKGFHDPIAKPEAKILVDNPRKPLGKLDLKQDSNEITISTEKIKVVFTKSSGLFKVINLSNQKVVLESIESIEFDPAKVSLTFKEQGDEYFYGGGVQNGRFSHKGKSIWIENQNVWTDGGVASPTPFYWSSKGYGLLWYTFKKGKYDFGAKEKGKVKLFHEGDYLDTFIMVNEQPVDLLKDFYQLTGNPVLLPKFGFYEGHLNAYNRDYWKEDDAKGILYEDGKKYVESQKDNGGIKESLNGEKNNYQFSARAVIDRYQAHDMPLGWILPNDGYGAGYGQTKTLDGNIQNLKEFGEYARKKGVEIGLWTQSDLHPKDGIDALLQRDIIKEVRDAGVRVLKTDVAWVGAGYSFGLNGVADVGTIMPKYGNNARPFIISLDGWAGTQRYAGIWSGDQTGGVWEYIRFHIPTYIGSGLSGQPNITSDVDGIFGGKKPIINIRDFQWKTFTPMQLNMDGWGMNPKYPQALDEPATSINRNYLKLKSELLPYSYSIAQESVNGLPMIRAMFLDAPNTYTQGYATQYQFMFGPYFLVAPIYKETKTDDKGNDIRNDIYLPKGLWVDYFTGEQYEGGRIINNIDAPIWKLPVFVKRGAIIPMTNPNNNVLEVNKHHRIYEVYPFGKSSFTEYDDDGITESYKGGKGAVTLISSELDSKNNATISVAAAKGGFEGFDKNKSTEFRVNITQKPSKIEAKIKNKNVKLKEVNSLAAFQASENVFFYDAQPNFNKFSTKGSALEKVIMAKNPQILIKLAKTDIALNDVSVKISDYKFEPKDELKLKSGQLSGLNQVEIKKENITAYTAKPTWSQLPNADFYEIQFDNQLYSTIKNPEFVLEDLQAETNYAIKVRAVNKDGNSDWKEIQFKTLNDPLQWTVKDIKGSTTALGQPGQSIRYMFDRDLSTMWHTKWDTKATPFDVIVDLRTINQLDKFEYIPRNDGKNGMLLKGKIAYSNNKKEWKEVGDFQWIANSDTKTFNFKDHPTARYIKISVDEGVGNFGSGRELYVYKVPGTESVLMGDINSDKMIDKNDLTSYLNYTGLRKGDSDFEGYVSIGDINQNNVIDAFDISNVATQLDDGVGYDKTEAIAGKLSISTPKLNYNKDEIVEITVKGTDLKSVNALGFALPYSQKDYEFVGVTPLNLSQMENFTNDRLHTNKEKVLYPTFINVGKKELINGSKDLFIIKLKAKQNLKFNLKLENGILVDKDLNSISL